MANMLLPFSPQSPTGIEGQRGIRDENIYSSGCLQHGGAGTITLFTIPQGQPIPFLRGAVVASVNNHQLLYSLATTNFVKAGEPGSLGDLAIRSMGIVLEQAAVTFATGLPRAFGATQFEVADCLSKLSLEFKVATKKIIEGPIFEFPSNGGSRGSISTSANLTTASMANNGDGSPRMMKIPIPCARADTIQALVSVAGGSALAFSTGAAADGQPTLMWVALRVATASDPR
jgi:hypothetical protein